MAGEHIGNETLARFFDRSLPEGEDARVRRHIDDCAPCRELFASVGAIETPRDASGESGPPTQAVPDLEPLEHGSILDGRYRIDRVIGEGGMGTVLLATHIELHHRVAIKVMHEEIADESDSVARILREGRAAAALRSDHALRIHDVGRTSSGLPFLVMEYLEGENLEAICVREAPAIETAVDWIVQACHAFAEAQSLGVVHRDVKPQNLFLTKLPDGSSRVKVVDFGLAKDTHKKGASLLTGQTLMLGSPYYMSPEQIRSSSTVDGRTDIWALGASLYRMLVGRPPFAAKNVAELLTRILSDPTPSVRATRPDVSPELDAIIGRCLEKDPRHRFQRAQDLAAALRAEATRAPATRTQRGYDAPVPTAVDAPTVVQRTEPIPEQSLTAMSAIPETVPATEAVPATPVMRVTGRVPPTLASAQPLGAPPEVLSPTAVMPPAELVGSAVFEDSRARPRSRGLLFVAILVAAAGGAAAVYAIRGRVTTPTPVAPPGAASIVMLAPTAPPPATTTEVPSPPSSPSTSTSSPPPPSSSVAAPSKPPKKAPARSGAASSADPIWDWSDTPQRK